MQTANRSGAALLPILDAGVAGASTIEPCNAVDALPHCEKPMEIGDAALPARLATLGCKVNQYETQYVRDLLSANGYRDARPGESAALAVVNTCTVTAESDSKSRQLIRQLGRENPGVKIVVMGCYATRDPAAVRRLPGVAAVIEDKRKLEESLKPFGVRKSIRGVRGFEGHQRAFVKVQDGCILDCTFCIIPRVRPGLLSRPPEDIVAEVAGLVEAGYREVVLTGIHLGHYGIDLSLGRPKSEARRLWHLLRDLAELPCEFRIRLSSLEATEVTDEFVETLVECGDRICPHLHLSMQSGSDAVLTAMRRRYRINRFIDRCEEIRSRLDEPAFTTDIIVGFPGETVEHFDETLRAIERIGFAKVHAFPFSAREGTPAAAMANQIARLEIKRRRQILAEVATRVTETYHARLAGRRLQMLVESPDPARPGTMRGTACRAAPLRLEALPALARQLVPVLAMSARDGAIDVVPVPDAA